MKICMAGASGRMGRRIIELALQEGIGIGGAFDIAETELTLRDAEGRPVKVPVGVDAGKALENAGVLIDFTLAGACLENVRAAVQAGKPAVVGTTGLSGEDQAALRELAAKKAIVYAPNMSAGVNLLFKLVGEVASVLGIEYNVEIVETHHNQKKDSPSGTAVRLAERAAEALGLDYGEHAAHGRQGQVGARPAQEIGLHAVRGGDVVGEHTVSFIGQGERVELTHKAHSRDNFAKGALRAARFAVNAEPGLYDMQDVLGLR